jgi:hypothetical protein
MTINISKSEMRLLGYLHENAKGYDERFMFTPASVSKALGITMDQLQKDSSFLSQHNLAVVKSLDMSTFNGINHQMVGLWLTGYGENLMRTVESDLEQELTKAPDYQPSVGVKFTMKAATFLMETAKDITVQVVSKAITG